MVVDLVLPSPFPDWHRDYFANPEVVSKAEKCVFIMVEFRGGIITRSTPTEPIGTGFFVGPRAAISAKHNFSGECRCEAGHNGFMFVYTVDTQ